MAHILPPSPTGYLPPEILRAFRCFRSWPDDYYVWHRLTPWVKEAPDFLLVKKPRCVVLVKVSSAHVRDARNAAQLLLMPGQGRPLGQAEETVLDDFFGTLPESLSRNVARVVLFPNIPRMVLLEHRPERPAPASIWLGQEALQTDAPELWDQAFAGEKLDTTGWEHLRARFAPEAVVPATLTVRTPEPRRLEAGLTDYLLDYDQELAVKSDLALGRDEQSLTRDFGINVVNGVAGSGKTLILLFRLRLLYELFPGKRFLILTHNRPLVRDLQARFKRLTGRLPENISWETFNSWCHHHWPAEPKWIDPIGVARRMQLIESGWREYFEGSAITAGSLESELAWVKDQVPMNRQAYLEAERRGRGFRLTREQRERMWSAILSYQKNLKKSGEVDWADIPRTIWKAIQEGTLKPPPFDVILVDEAQFFAPIWFDVVRRLLRPRTGHLFVVADPGQGFLGRGASWKSLGLDVRGHTHKLRHSHRTTHEILNFATLFYRQRIREDDAEEEVIPPDLLDMPRGVLPYLIPLTSSQDEVARVANEITGLANRGQPLDSILVLHAGWEGVDALIEAICARLGKNAAGDPKNDLPGNFVRVTTLNAGTGLESPIVFLAGLNSLFEKEQSLRLSDEEREKLIHENTRKVYMAATRAGQRLVFTYVGPLPDVLRGLLIKSPDPVLPKRP